MGRWETNCYKNVESVFDVMEKVRKTVPKSTLLILADPQHVNIPRPLRNSILPIGFPDDRELADIMEQIDLAMCVSL